MCGLRQSALSKRRHGTPFNNTEFTRPITKILKSALERNGRESVGRRRFSFMLPSSLARGIITTTMRRARSRSVTRREIEREPFQYFQDTLQSDRPCGGMHSHFPVPLSQMPSYHATATEPTQQRATTDATRVSRTENAHQ